MKKTFTVNVPNELYVNDFSGGKTATFEYDGPETIDVAVDAMNRLLQVVDENDVFPPNTKIVTIDANINPEVASLITNKSIPHEYEYVDEVNIDGSIYKRIANPRINDYYELTYCEGSVGTSPDGLRNGEWLLCLITKDPDTLEEKQARKNLQYVTSRLKNIDLNDQDQLAYDNFVSESTAYLETMKNVYPWKFVEIKSPLVPKVPLSLIKIINEIPAEIG